MVSPECERCYCRCTDPQRWPEPPSLSDQPSSVSKLSFILESIHEVFKICVLHTNAVADSLMPSSLILYRCPEFPCQSEFRGTIFTTLVHMYNHVCLRDIFCIEVNDRIAKQPSHYLQQDFLLVQCIARLIG